MLSFFRFLFVFVSLHLSLNTYSQKESYKVFTYGVQDGLSQGSVYSILQDHLGFVWMTSNEGLNKFDGSSFIVYKDDLLDSRSLFGNATIGLVQDSSKNIWVGTEKCLNKFDYQTGNFSQIFAVDGIDTLYSQHYPFFANDSIVIYANRSEGLMSYNFLNEKKQLLSNKIRYESNFYLFNSMATKDGEHFWIRRDEELVLYVFSRNSETIFFDQNAKENSHFVSCLDIDKKGKAWVIYGNKLFIISSEGNIETNYDIPLAIKSTILDIKIKDENTYWLGTSKEGLFLIDINKGIVNNFNSNSDEKSALPSHLSSNMYLDKYDNIWASSDPNGVFFLQVDESPFKKITKYYQGGVQIDLKGVKSFAQFGNEILIGTKFHELIAYNLDSEIIYDHPVSTFLANQEVSALWVARDGTLWVGTYDGIYHYSEGKMQHFNQYNLREGNESKVVWSIVEDRAGNIYFSTDAGIYVWNNNSKEISQLPVFIDHSSGFLLIDSQNNILIPKHNDGFTRIDLDKLWKGENAFNENIAYPRFFQNEINVKCAIEDLNIDIYWLATTNGIYKVRLNEKNVEILQYYGSQQGLSSNYIYGLLDHGEEIWFSSNRGIGKINKKSGKVITYSLSDGLQDLEFNSNSFLIDDRENFYFGGVNGFNVFYPEQIKDANGPSTAPILVDIDFGNEIQRINKTKEIYVKINYNKSSFRLNFTTPYFARKSPINYAYRVNRGNWINNGDSKTIAFNNLSANGYVIECKSFISNIDEENPITKLSLELLPPWYNSRWFFLLSVFIFLSIGYTYLRWRTGNIREKESLRSRIAETRLTALQSQMNPHFVFNCLNTIDGYIASNERFKASKFLGDFSKLIRTTLQNSRNSEISLKSELELINQYVKLEQKRTDSSFDYQYDIRETSHLNKIKIPPLLVQPYVENAIKHGLRDIETPRILNIAGERIKFGYLLTIFDNGKGFDPTVAKLGKHSFGLKITNERLSLFNIKNKTNIKVKITSLQKQSKKGTTIEFLFPIL